jgi:hypothetical protein
MELCLCVVLDDKSIGMERCVAGFVLRTAGSDLISNAIDDLSGGPVFNDVNTSTDDMEDAPVFGIESVPNRVAATGIKFTMAESDTKFVVFDHETGDPFTAHIDAGNEVPIFEGLCSTSSPSTLCHTSSSTPHASSSCCHLTVSTAPSLTSTRDRCLTPTLTTSVVNWCSTLTLTTSVVDQSMRSPAPIRISVVFSSTPTTKI